MEFIHAQGHFVLYIAFLLIGVATYLVANMLLQEQESRVAQENLADTKNRKSSNPLVQVTRPFFTQYVVPLIRGKPYWDIRKRHYRRKLIAAGLQEELNSDELIAFKLFLILFFPAVFALLRALDFLYLPTIGIFLTTGLGWFYPDFWIKSRIAARQKIILRSLPFIVDVLALSTEAGLDFIGAIGKVVEKAVPSPLVDELGQVLREIRVGSSRQDALREMAARIDMTEINSFIAILISADQMGASIGKVLRQQADQVRVERLLRAERAGAAASQKLLLPLIFLIVPAVFLIVFGPVVVGYFSAT